MSDLFDLPFEEEHVDVESREPIVESLPAAAPRLPPPDARPATRPVLTVTELTVRVRDLLEGELFEIWVEGELSNCRVWNTGHLYFTLKDSAAQLRGFMFKSALR